MITEKTSFVGRFEGTADDLINQFIRINPSKADRAKRLAPLYIKYGELFNLRADIAWAQMEHETGFLEFKGDVKPGQNNFVGIGATGGVPGNSFATEELGIIAQFAHLAWYYFKDHVNAYCSNKYDPRHFGTTHYKYTGNTSLAFLSGLWAVPGIYKQPDGSVITYSGQIAKLANQIFISAPMVGTVENIAQHIKDFLNITGQKNWEYIAVHHTVSNPLTTTMAKIKQWHLARGFIREGYNFGINGNGEIETGRPLNMSGAHAGPLWNSKAIGVALYGDFRYDKLSSAQKKSAFKLIKELMEKYSIPIKNVKGHREFGLATACPVIDMNLFREELIKYIWG
jgi:hypothetical protein